jgi:hypothetical protein
VNPLSDSWRRRTGSSTPTPRSPERSIVTRRRLPRQVHILKVDSGALVDLGKKVSGGTLPRLSCDRSVVPFEGESTPCLHEQLQFVGGHSICALHPRVTCSLQL